MLVYDCLKFSWFLSLQGNDNYVGIAARDTANALQVFVNAARGVAANSSDKQEQILIIESAREVIARSNELLEVARNAIDNPNNPDNQQRLQQVRFVLCRTVILEKRENHLETFLLEGLRKKIFPHCRPFCIKLMSVNLIG